MVSLSAYETELDGHVDVLNIDPSHFGPGSILVVRTKLTDKASAALHALKEKGKLPWEIKIKY